MNCYDFKPQKRRRVLDIGTHKMAEILDATGEDIVPYLIHFSKRRIVPKILNVEGGFAITMIKAEGKRLGELLLQRISEEKLVQLYRQIGRNAGYIAKYNVAHNDLNPYNIIIENDLPVIIDWGKAGFGNFGQDTEVLMGDTRKLVSQPKMQRLEDTFLGAFMEENKTPLGVSHQEIQETAFREFGVV